MSKNLPTVAIIGRANVGKSSLFNRLVGSQRAIVAREEGTTRDSVVEKVIHQDHTFWLVDTAGLKTAQDEFEATIQEQIVDASDAADVILVVVEADVPVSDQDRIVTKKALRSKKPTFLIINKTDKAGAQPNEEFQRLGVKLDNMIRTSAEHKSGIEDLFDKITAILPERRNIIDDDTVRIAFIGRPNVGKSSLFNTLGGKQQAIVANLAGTTRDVNRLQVRYHQQTVELLDTAGIRRNGKVEVGVEKFSVLRSVKAIEESDVCLLLIDVNDLNVAFDQRLAGIIKEAGKGLIIVVSKWDNLAEKDAFSRDEIAKKLTKRFDFVPWAPLIFTSATTGQNVTKLFDLSLEIYNRRRHELKTSELNKILQTCLARHPASGLRNRHPKLRYLVQTDTAPPWFVLFGSDLRYLHWSYKRYLENNMREVFDFTGTPIMFSYRDQKVEKQRAEKIALKNKKQPHH